MVALTGWFVIHGLCIVYFVLTRFVVDFGGIRGCFVIIWFYLCVFRWVAIGKDLWVVLHCGPFVNLVWVYAACFEFYLVFGLAGWCLQVWFGGLLFCVLFALIVLAGFVFWLLFSGVLCLKFVFAVLLFFICVFLFV